MNPFFRSQVSSFVSTLVDFGVTIALTELAGWWYLISTATGTLSGGLTNFELGRHWVFRAAAVPPLQQARRYLMVWAGSLALNVGLVFLLTTVAQLHYIYSKVFVSCLVSVSFNYYFQRTYVYRKPDDLA